MDARNSSLINIALPLSSNSRYTSELPWLAIQFSSQGPRASSATESSLQPSKQVTECDAPSAPAQASARSCQESLSSVSHLQKSSSRGIFPDISAPGAYDEAVQGVKYVIHVASPVPRFDGSEAAKGSDEELFVQPAVCGAIGMLESANTTGRDTVKRVVMTSSIVAFVPLHWWAEPPPPGADILPASNRQRDLAPPYFEAYFASKIASLNAADAWMDKTSPSFDLILTMPAWICGKDELCTSAEQLLGSSSSKVLYPLIGQKIDTPIGENSVSVVDCALAHVQALDPKVEGNQSFFLGGAEDLAQSHEVAKKHFPRAFEKGILKKGGHQVTVSFPLDGSVSDKALGVERSKFKDWAQELLEQYAAPKQ